MKGIINYNKMKNKGKSPPFDEVKGNRSFAGEENDLPGYPVYPPQEDIYHTYEEADLNPEDLAERKNVFKFPKSQEVTDIETGDDLDVPGVEPDNEQEYLECEDEENNYFSLGGDNHESLEEDLLV